MNPSQWDWRTEVVFPMQGGLGRWATAIVRDFVCGPEFGTCTVWSELAIQQSCRGIWIEWTHNEANLRKSIGKRCSTVAFRYTFMCWCNTKASSSFLGLRKCLNMLRKTSKLAMLREVMSWCMSLLLVLYRRVIKAHWRTRYAIRLSVQASN